MNSMHATIRQLGLIGFSSLAVLALSAGMAQATTASTPTLRVFYEESMISLHELDAAPLARFAPGVLGVIRMGALEIRQSISYDPRDAILRVTGFLVDPEAPFPTAASAQPRNVIWSYTAQVSEVRLSTKARYSVVFIGRINGGAVTAIGDVSDVSLLVSAAYVPATAGRAVTHFSAIETNLVGTAILFSASGWGNAQIDIPSVPPCLPSR